MPNDTTLQDPQGQQTPPQDPHGQQTPPQDPQGQQTPQQDPQPPKETPQAASGVSREEFSQLDQKVDNVLILMEKLTTPPSPKTSLVEKEVIEDDEETSSEIEITDEDRRIAKELGL